MFQRDPNGMGRAYDRNRSQTTPFTDVAAPATPSASSAGGVTGQGSATPQNVGVGNALGATGAITAPTAPTPSTTRQATVSPRPQGTVQDPYDYLAGVKNRSVSQLPGAVGSVAGGIGGAAGAGAAFGSVGGPLGSAIGAAGGALGSLLGGQLGKHAATAPTDYSRDDAASAVQNAYGSYLGRQGSQQEILSQLAGQGLKPGDRWVGSSGLDAVLQSIKNSPEAQAYAGQAQQSTTTPAQTTTGTVTPGANWNTDGYSAPQYLAQNAAAGPMAGWDQTKWASTDHQTPKYAVGRILSQYAPDQAGFSAAVADIQKAYPGTTTDGKDKVTIPGVGTIDVRTGAEQGGTGWAWQPLDEQGSSSQLPVNTALSTAILNPSTTPTLNAQDPAFTSNIMQWLMNQLAVGGGLTGGQTR